MLTASWTDLRVLKSDDEESYSRGKRIRNGWKNGGGPWTYDIEISTMAAAAK